MAAYGGFSSSKNQIHHRLTNNNKEWKKNENDTGFRLQKRQMPNNEKRLQNRFGRVGCCFTFIFAQTNCNGLKVHMKLFHLVEAWLVGSSSSRKKTGHENILQKQRLDEISGTDIHTVYEQYARNEEMK